MWKLQLLRKRIENGFACTIRLDNETTLSSLIMLRSLVQVDSLGSLQFCQFLKGSIAVSCIFLCSVGTWWSMVERCGMEAMVALCTRSGSPTADWGLVCHRFTRQGQVHTSFGLCSDMRHSNVNELEKNPFISLWFSLPVRHYNILRYS